MSQQVTVLGAGIVGICCAMSLAQRGVSVRLIDRDEPGQGTSSGNSGIISPWSIIPMSLPGLWKKVPGMMVDNAQPLKVRNNFWPKMIPWGMKFLGQGGEASVRQNSDAMQVLCKPSIDLYRQHLQGTGAEDLVKDSYYVHAFRDGSKANLDSLDYLIRREKGADLELIGADQLRLLEPTLSHDFQAAVLIKDQARAVSPGNIAAAIAEKASLAGVEILRSNVNSLSHNGNQWTLNCDDGKQLNCDKLVLAAGFWSGELLKTLGRHYPMVAERGYHVEFANPGIEVNYSVMDVDARVVASSMSGGMRMAGAAEFGFAGDPPDPKRRELMIQQSKAMFPELDDKQASFWMGHRPSLPDSLPIIGEIGGFEGLYGAFGHSHYGLMMAPKTGELIADILTETEHGIDLSAYSEKRFR